MTDTLLQAFCERCGTRYTSSAPEPPPAVESGKSRLGLFGRRGQDQQPEEERPAVSNASPSSDAFAGTFHFCMDCRQYVCTKCWNNDAGGCLTDRPPQRAGETASSGSAMRRPFAARADTLPWKAGAGGVRASSDGVELDEWGRPRKKEQAAPAEDVAKPAFGAELDPWRGVVFTDEERNASSPAPAESTDAPAASNLDLRSESSLTVPPQAWPETDRPQEPAEDPTESAPAWPQTDRPQQPEPEPEREPEPEVAAEEPEPVPEAEPEPEPEMAAIEPVPEPVPEPEPEPVPEPEPEPQMAAVEPEPVLQAEPEPEPEPDPGLSRRSPPSSPSRRSPLSSPSPSRRLKPSQSRRSPLSSRSPSRRSPLSSPSPSRRLKPSQSQSPRWPLSSPSPGRSRLRSPNPSLNRSQRSRLRPRSPRTTQRLNQRLSPARSQNR